MYGLTFREKLPPVVVEELDNLIAAFRQWGLTEHNEDGTHITTLPVGSIVQYGVAIPPSTNWLLCDGKNVSRVTYATLFNVIGVKYGSANSDSFKLPDLTPFTVVPSMIYAGRIY